MDVKQTLIDSATVVTSAILVYMGQRGIKKQLETSSTLEEDRDLKKMKREAYASFIESMEEHLQASIFGDVDRRKKSEQALNRALALIDLSAPKEIYLLAQDVMDFVDLDFATETRLLYVEKMYTLMRTDLNLVDPDYKMSGSAFKRELPTSVEVSAQN